MILKGLPNKKVVTTKKGRRHGKVKKKKVMLFQFDENGFHELKEDQYSERIMKNLRLRYEVVGEIKQPEVAYVAIAESAKEIVEEEKENEATEHLDETVKENTDVVEEVKENIEEDPIDNTDEDNEDDIKTDALIKELKELSYPELKVRAKKAGLEKTNIKKELIIDFLIGGTNNE